MIESLIILFVIAIISHFFDQKAKENQQSYLRKHKNHGDYRNSDDQEQFDDDYDIDRSVDYGYLDDLEGEDRNSHFHKDL